MLDTNKGFVNLFIKREKIILIIFLSALVFLTFGRLAQAFFQQDEWQFFGSSISALFTSNPYLTVMLPFGGQITHFYPLATLFWLLEYLIFKNNFYFYAAVSIGLHTLCAFLVYILIFKITEKRVVALFTSILFAANSFSHQAVTWVLGSALTLPAMLFLIASFIYFYDYLKSNLKSKLILSLLFLVISLLFKEVAIFPFILYPVLIMIFFWYQESDKFNIFKLLKERKLFFISITSIFTLYILIRTAILLFTLYSPQPEIGDVSSAHPLTYLQRIISVPLKGVAQSFLPQKFLISISEKVTLLFFPQFSSTGVADPTFSQTMAFEIVCYTISVLIIVLSILLFLWLDKRREKVAAFSMLVALLGVTISLLPYIFIPGKAGYFSIFEPRNLYIPIIFSSLLLVIFIYKLAEKLFKSERSIFLVLVIVLTPLILFHILTVRKDIQEQQQIGVLRLSFLTTLEMDYPKLPEKVVIYTESNKPYYGMLEEEKTLPLQSGFGRMVLVWYQDKEKFPTCFYQEQFLHDLLSQGYKYCQGRGFGYFRNYNQLTTILETEGLNEENVIGYSWDGNLELFENKTAQIRKKLKVDLNEN